MNAVAKHEDETRVVQLAEPTTDAGALMAVIGRAASDPAMDVDKLERLIGMYERITDRQGAQAYDVAMSKAQSEMGPVRADAHNPQTKSKYASYAALDRALRPIYTKHGFGLSFDTADSPLPDHVRVLCYVSHKKGDKRTHRVDMPNDGKGAKGGDVMTKTHAQGAAFTYGQRYLEKLIFNIAVGDDDDGNSGRPLRDRSTAFEAAVAGVNACGTLEDLKAWKAKNAAGLSALANHEAEEVVRLANDRARRFREGGE